MTVGTDNTGRKQFDVRFKPGRSGNPSGRPKGSRNAATLAMEALLDGQAGALTQKAIELALGGDIQALKLCMDRILPPRKDRPITFNLPTIKTAQDAVMVASAVLEAAAAADITPADACEISKLLDTWIKVFETSELAERLERLEQGLQ